MHTHLNIEDVRRFARLATDPSAAEEVDWVIRFSSSLEACEDCQAAVRAACALLLPPEYVHADPSVDQEDCLSPEKLCLLERLSDNEHVAGCARCLLRFHDVRAMSMVVQSEYESSESVMFGGDQSAPLTPAPAARFVKEVVVSLRPRLRLMITHGRVIEGEGYRRTAAGGAGQDSRVEILDGPLAGATVEPGSTSVKVTNLPPNVSPGELVLVAESHLCRPTAVAPGAAHFEVGIAPLESAECFILPEIEVRAHLLSSLRPGADVDDGRRVLAVRMLGELRSRAALPTLRALLKQADGEFHVALRSAIERIEH